MSKYVTRTFIVTLATVEEVNVEDHFSGQAADLD